MICKLLATVPGQGFVQFVRQRRSRCQFPSRVWQGQSDIVAGCCLKGMSQILIARELYSDEGFICIGVDLGEKYIC
jgi:hypothetical protein